MTAEATPETPPETIGGWAIIRGAAMRATAARVADCPYRKGTPQALCWRWGFDHDKRERARRRNITRETEMTARPGRGRPREGTRGEYSDLEKAVLRICDGNVEQAEIAAMLGRPRQGVRIKLKRLRAEDRDEAN